MLAFVFNKPEEYAIGETPTEVFRTKSYRRLCSVLDKKTFDTHDIKRYLVLLQYLQLRNANVQFVAF